MSASHSEHHSEEENEEEAQAEENPMETVEENSVEPEAQIDFEPDIEPEIEPAIEPQIEPEVVAEVEPEPEKSPEPEEPEVIPPNQEEKPEEGLSPENLPAESAQIKSDPETTPMEEIAANELESLKFSESELLPTEQDSPKFQNNENETVEEQKQISHVPNTQTPSSQRSLPVKSGIRPPSAVLRQPKVPAPAVKTTKMPREQSDVRKSTSTRSIDNVGKFTPKVNAKFVNVKSKIGSVTNHKAGGGNVEIFSEKKTYKAQSKVGSMQNASHVAGGGNVQIESRKLDFSHASPKVGSKTNYQPAKSDVKIVSQKLTWQAQSKVGSMENAAHKPTGGNVQILTQKLDWKAQSKVGSKDNMNHRPGGGNVKIFDEKIRYVSADSSRNHSALDISSL
ncbi:CBN-PTL-1 protein [Caenorhabditis brenneri]|uniref:Microtubule-associated protein n=1 Tax=Caenorhabditis brenneri TaxID=135651 RepID=G0MYX8_CAEBE|nr:CBN-PTL-1 protein [Caenorhabditis brenneri]